MRNNPIHASVALFAMTLLACGADHVGQSPPNVSPLDTTVGEIFRPSDARLNAVTREFGPTIVSRASLPYRSEVVEADHKPWSSWWYPHRETTLYERERGELSPLQKYDLVRRHGYGRGSAPPSAAEYERNLGRTNALPWEGLCDAWSFAAILMPEPKRPVTVSLGRRTVTFSVDDIKALLLKSFEAIDDAGLLYYGQRFAGSEDAWIYPDLYPDQFHRLVEVQLMRDRQPFLMDHDAGVEVWSVPVYKANYVMKAVEGRADAVAVTMWVTTVEPTLKSEVDFVGTKELIREYNYVLTGRLSLVGDLVVEGGYWVKGASGVDSRRDHPDYAVRVAAPGAVVRKSWNPAIDPGLIDQIASQAL